VQTSSLSTTIFFSNMQHADRAESRHLQHATRNISLAWQMRRRYGPCLPPRMCSTRFCERTACCCFAASMISPKRGASGLQQPWHTDNGNCRSAQRCHPLM
jgi:hypothetical protein